jgi:hypothetical protein
MQFRHFRSVAVGVLAAGMLTSVAFAAKDLKAQPVTFAGNTVDECGSPVIAGDRKHAVARWDNKVGEQDDNGNADFALRLEKNAPTTECTAAGAIIDGAEGQPAFVTYGFDYKTGTYCGAGAPRFNLVASDGFHFVGGCANGTASPGPEAGWTSVTFNPATQAFPPITPGATIVSLSLIQDEQGQALLDNIRVGANDPITKPGR